MVGGFQTLLKTVFVYFGVRSVWIVWFVFFEISVWLKREVTMIFF